MSGPQRKPDQTAISVSMSKALLEQLDARAAALGLNRSQYLTQLARRDVAEKGSLTLHESPKVNLPPDGVRAAAGNPVPTEVTYKLKRK